MRKPSTYRRTLQEIIDSDDEITTDFEQSSYIAAYKDDSRFEYFQDLMEKEKQSSKSKHKIDTSASSHEETFKSGIFSEKDVLCLQCVKSVQSDTLIWLFEFLIHKDLQSNYKFLKSCLVPKFENYYSNNCYVINSGRVGCSNGSQKVTQYKYEIVVNK